MPKPSGEEEKFLKIIGMNQVPIVWRDVHYDYLKSRLLEMTPEELAVAYHDLLNLVMNASLEDVYTIVNLIVG